VLPQLSPIPVSRLAAVACHFNPGNYTRPRENFLRFRDLFRGCDLFTVEVSFDGQFHLDTNWRIAADHRHMMWQKEQLLNWAFRQVPPEYDALAWIDADLLFLNPNWAEQTLQQLQHFPVAQLFEMCRYIDCNGHQTLEIPSFLSRRKDPACRHGAPGGAWAARRELIARHGLYARNIVGGGDQTFAHALFGLADRQAEKETTRAVFTHARHWQTGVRRETRGHVGLVPGDVVHLYHGSLDKRGYATRRRILLDSDYDPARDVREGANGLLEWATDKPALHAAVRDYFASRCEDA
jgi:hypothetical protein